MQQKKNGAKQIADNRAVRHSYFVLEEFEAGIALQGNEVKSIQARQCEFERQLV